MTAADTSIHPRLRDRRQAVQESVGRRRLIRLGSLAAVALVGAGGWGLTRSPLLDVDQVDVSGARRTGGDKVAAAAAVETGTPLTDVDLAAAGARIAELPWIATAEVSRSWPGTVTITVTERVPAVAVETARGWRLVDVEGRVLAKLKVDESGAVVWPKGLSPLPTLRGVEGSARPGDWLADAPAGAVSVAASSVVALEPAAVAGTRIDSQGVVIDATLEGWAFEVVVGEPTEVAEKLAAAATVIERVDLFGIARIDVRVPSAPVVNRR